MTQELTPQQIAVREQLITAVDAGKSIDQILTEMPGLGYENAIAFSIKRHYDTGRGSIQDYARIYRKTVAEVLATLEQDEMSTVQLIGDLIDKSEAGTAQLNDVGETYQIPYDVS
jgi:hypothetical protein